MPSPYRYRVAAICWLAAIFRYRSLLANHFHADEALFASWARQIAVWRDPLLLTQPVDKPPLLFYLQALFFPLFGPVEWAARLPNFIVSLLLVPLLGLLAWRLYGDGLTPLIASGLLALSPLAIQFSATAFTDPLLTFWLVMALALAVRPSMVDGGHPYPAFCGVAFGLAAATKYQAWLFLPLLVAIAGLSGWTLRDWRRGALGAAAVGVVVTGWLLARLATGSLLALQVANAGGLRPAWSWELWPRLVAWSRLGWISLGWPVVVTSGLAAVLWLVRQGRQGGRRSQIGVTDALLVMFLLSYVTLHWLFAVPVWDRYLLPVLPLALLLVARLVSDTWRWVMARLPEKRAVWAGGMAIVIALLMLMFVPASAARLGRLPIGGQPTADQGAWRVGVFLQDAPYGTVLYDHWYSWQWRYHLFDTGVYVSWFPHSTALADDLAVFGGDSSSRYLVLPAGPVAGPVRRAVADAGYTLVAETLPAMSAEVDQLMLYRLEKHAP